jgi:AcrR family transcriptional regulator
MARKALVEDDELLARLGTTFRDVGYEGASLALLSESTGLKKASLYHRFPGGKEEMGAEVLAEAGRWLSEHVLVPLAGPGSPRERLQSMARELDQFYDGGRKSCLLNMLSAPIGTTGTFGSAIRVLFEAFIDALTKVAIETGKEKLEARVRAERAVALIQGSLVLARGLGTAAPFRRLLSDLADDLLGTAEPET